MAFGGALRDVQGHVQPGPGHDVRTLPGSLIASLIGTVARTTTLHHQAVAEPGPHWRPTAWANETIEAIEPVDGRWPALGVQWHPELRGVEAFVDETGPALFRWLFDQAALRAAAVHSQYR